MVSKLNGFRNLFIVVMTLCYVFQLKAQDLTHIVFHDDDGLPSREVYSVEIDEQGYLWAGTAFGLSRYNGQGFETISFKGQRGSSYSLLTKDSFGRIWAHNFVGQIVCADVDSVRILEAYSDSIATSYAFFAIYDTKWLYAVGKNGVWKAEIKYNISEMRFERVFTEFSGSFLTDDEQFGLILSNQRFGIQQYKPGFPPYNLLKINPEQLYRTTSFVMNEVLYVVSNQKKEVYFQTKPFTELKKHEELSKLLSVIKGNINTVKKRGNLLWFLTEQGIYVLDNQLKPLKNAFPALENYNCSSVAQDRDGRFWVSTLSDGVLLIPSFETISYLQSNSPLSDDKISTLVKNDETVWIGTRLGSVIPFNRADKQLKKPIFTSNFPIQYISSSPFDKTILALSNNSLINLTNPEINIKRPKPRAIKSISWVDEATFLSAESGGAYLESLSKEKENWITELLKKTVQREGSPYRANILAGNQIVTLVDEKGKQFWLGGRSGLVHFSDKGIEEIKHPITQTSFYPFRILLDKQDNVWVGGISGDVFVIHNNRVIAFGEANTVIKGNSIRSMEADENGVWIGTNEGLQFWGNQDFQDDVHVFKPQEWIYTSKTDGLISNELTGLADLGDELLMASFNGLQRMSKSFINKKIAEPTVYLNQIWVSGNRKTQREFDLPYDSNKVQITFSGVSFASGSGLKLAYRMIGLSEDWIEVNRPKETVSFLDLNPGSYQFEAKSVNKNGESSKNQIQIPIEIAQPFWLSWWFITIALGLSLFVIVLIFRYRIQQQQAAFEEQRLKTYMEDQLKISRLTALQSQMNPHFIYNALNSIQHFIFANDKRASNRFLGKFADLMRLVMQHSAQEKISLKEELETLEIYLELEKMRLDDGFNFNIVTEENLEAESVFIPPMFVQPYLENSIKHGFMGMKKLGELQVSVSIDAEQMVVFKIEDNGRGREATLQMQQLRKYSSFSGKANQRRFELLKSLYGNAISVEFVDKKDSQEQALGTIVYLRLPNLNSNFYV
ncbi:hypothetical protein EP331_03510 [bacterium]|nr:MAG: hypothetical protein EP331_03510 [bacterium]